jgi:hypothetical protein
MSLSKDTDPVMVGDSLMKGLKAVQKPLVVVSSPWTDLRREPVAREIGARRDPLQETQLLMGEPFVVERVQGNWLYGRAVWQPVWEEAWLGYPGWLHADDVADAPTLPSPNLAVAALRSTLLPSGQSLTLGTLLTGDLLNDDWWQVGDQKIAASEVVPLTGKPDPLRAFAAAQAFLSLPYVWGGRSEQGVDCSSLVQLAYQMQGVFLPRNAKDQARVCTGTGGTLLFSKNDNDIVDHVILRNGDRLVEAAGAFDCVREGGVLERVQALDAFDGGIVQEDLPDVRY